MLSRSRTTVTLSVLIVIEMCDKQSVELYDKPRRAGHGGALGAQRLQGRTECLTFDVDGFLLFGFGIFLLLRNRNA